MLYAHIEDVAIFTCRKPTKMLETCSYMSIVVNDADNPLQVDNFLYLGKLSANIEDVAIIVTCRKQQKQYYC